LEEAILKVRTDPSPVKTVRQKIVDFLLKQTQAKTPMEIAEGAGVNANSTRREVQQLLKVGFLEKEEHAYRIAKLPDQTTLNGLPWQRCANACKERIPSDTQGAEKLLAQLSIVDTLTVGGYKYRLENRSEGKRRLSGVCEPSRRGIGAINMKVWKRSSGLPERFLGGWNTEA